ncbi:Methylthioribulose-1-phosphate dehydratase, partial [Rhizophlyctis rosea]
MQETGQWEEYNGERKSVNCRKIRAEQLSGDVEQTLRLTSSQLFFAVIGGDAWKRRRMQNSTSRVREVPPNPKREKAALCNLKSRNSKVLFLGPETVFPALPCLPTVDPTAMTTDGNSAKRFKADLPEDPDALVRSTDPEHPANLIPELCRLFYTLGWVTGTG